MEHEILEILKQMQESIMELKEGQTRLESKIDENAKDIKEIKIDLKDFKYQFIDYEGKTANNHVEVINKVDNIQKDLNSVEIITSKNWNDIANLKAIR